MKGSNIRKSIRITFEEAVFGCEKELDLVLKDPCSTCNGTGAKPGTSPETCPKCGRQKVVVIHPVILRNRSERTVPSPNCRRFRKGDQRKMYHLAQEPDLHPAERRFRYPFLQELIMDRVYGSGKRENREQTADRAEIFLWKSMYQDIRSSSVRICIFSLPYRFRLHRLRLAVM